MHAVNVSCLWAKVRLILGNVEVFPFVISSFRFEDIHA